MAKPHLQIEQKVDKLEQELKRHKLAIGTMAQWLVQAQTGFGAHDAEGIEKILRGEDEEEKAKEREETSDDCVDS